MKSLYEIIQNEDENSSETNALQLSQPVSQRLQKIRESFPTFNDFSTKFSPDIWKKVALHPTRCVDGTSPTLTDVNLTFGDGKAIMWLMAQLGVLQEHINVPNKMSVYALETCAQVIYDNYHHLKCSELMLFFARLIGGLYDIDWHGYITPTKIVSAIREHFMPWRNDLLYKIEKNRQEQQREKDYDNPDNMTYDEWQEIKTIISMYNSEYVQ